MKKIKKRKKKQNIIFYLIISISLITLIYSLINIIIWYIDNKKTKENLENINKIVNVTEIEDSTINNESTNEDNNKSTNEDNEEVKDDPYYAFRNINLINVNIDDLKQINDEIVGYLSVNNTTINYPIVKHSDNSFYLNHSIDKSYNVAGWVFLDYRNNINTLNFNTIIYAHNMTNGTMFSDLLQVLNTSWFNNESNHYIRLVLNNSSYLFKIFSVYKIKTTSDYLDIYNNSADFINLITSRSLYNFNISPTSEDKILTLSTCYDNNSKVVIHSILVKEN